MKVVHIADTHLGFRAYPRRIDGLNARERDIYISWLRLIEEIKKEKPDVVVHAGDLFNFNRTSATTDLMAQRLSELPCPVLVVAGTHDEKRSGDHSPVMPLNIISNVTAVEKTTLEFVHGMSFCLQPWVRDEDITYHDADFFVGHLPLTGIPEYAYNQSYTIPHKKYQACFMGDLHRHLIYQENVIYPGPLERLTFNEEGVKVGYVVWDNGVITFKPLKARELLTLTDPAFTDELLAHCTDKIVRVRVTKEMDLSELREVAFHIQIEPIRSGASLPAGIHGTLAKNLDTQWGEFTKAKGKDAYKEEGATYLQKSLEKQEV